MLDLLLLHVLLSLDFLSDLLLHDLMLFLRSDQLLRHALPDLLLDLSQLLVLASVQILHVQQRHVQLLQVLLLDLLPVVELLKMDDELRALEWLVLVFREIVCVAYHRLVGRVLLPQLTLLDLGLPLVH